MANLAGRNTMTTFEEMVESTIWINTMNDFAEPKKWAALPLINNYGNCVEIIDAYGDRHLITVEKKENKLTSE